MQFSKLDLIPSLCANLEKEGYEKPTPVQTESIPAVLAGRDLLACAQTGTGKTAAFALPILQTLSRTRPVNLPCGAHVLVLTPTRELAEQIGESFGVYGRGLNLKTTVVYGGVGYVPQKDALRRGVDVLVATPGRLLDLIEQRAVILARTAVFVLDEADRMLDMGFIRDVRRIAEFLPRRRQTLLFSATMPAEIRSLAENLLVDPHQVQVAPPSATADNIDQSVYFVAKADKPALLRHLLSHDAAERVLVFTRTKHGADRVARKLCRAGIDAESIHGDKAQGARRRSLDRFKTGEARVLVATDVASRGIDIDSISHVVNYELPDVPETYIHRIGRTARAGASGVSVSFCDEQERVCLRDIERLIRARLKVMETPDITLLEEDLAAERKAQAAFDRLPDRDRPARRHNERRDRGNGNGLPFYEKFSGPGQRGRRRRDGRREGSGRIGEDGNRHTDSDGADRKPRAPYRTGMFRNRANRRSR
ncbi:MAG: DEAD/DEAH box helicase [Spirochaetales bacterium]|nr:DEAD/DEAH box helicase [Spirochaetales bacterium]